MLVDDRRRRADVLGYNASTSVGPVGNLIAMTIRSAPSSDPAEHSLPGAYALHVLALARRWGVTAAQLLSEFGLDERGLEAPDSRVPIPLVSSIVQRARQLTNEPGLGILMGLETRVNTYGYLSFASMCAASLGECIELAIRFSPAITTAYCLRLNRAGEIAALVAEEECDVGEARDFMMLVLLIGLRSIGCALTGREPWRPIDVVMPEPAYYRRFAHLVPELRFGQPINQIVLLESDLELPLLTPDRAALRLAVEQCERSMQALGLGASLDQRVIQFILGHDKMPSLEEAASALGLSSRTLKRRLAESNVTFSNLVEKARRERALLLLRSPELSLDEVAERLGYSTTSNLVRAFRRWTGMTPAAYRRGVSGRLAIHLPIRRMHE